MISPDMEITFPHFFIALRDDKENLLTPFRVYDVSMIKFNPDSLVEADNFPLSLVNVTSVRPAGLKTSIIFF